jgi:hypothetical protein
MRPILALDATDIRSWKTTAVILGIISIVMFAIQRSSYMFLDPLFEICIFHLPAIIAIGFYVYLKRKTPTLVVEGVKSV